MTLQRQLPFQRSKCLNKIPHESNCNVSNSANHHSTCEQSHGSRVKWSIQALPSFQLDSLASAAHHGYQHRRLRATLQHCIGVWHHHAWSQITGGRPKGSPSPTPIMRWVFQDHNETNPLSDFFFPMRYELPLFWCYPKKSFHYVYCWRPPWAQYGILTLFQNRLKL